MKKKCTLFFFRLFLFFPLLLFTSVIRAQEIPVTFKVFNQKKEPVPFVSITLTNRLDTLQVLKKVADSVGAVIFKLNKEGQYTIGITSVNYQALEKGIMITGNQSVFTFALEPLPKTLAGVVITSQKPMIRQEDDKTIVDAENLAATSTSGYEVLEKTPGLFVDQDGNVYITSMTPASIYINGREMKMSAADVATMLKSLPPNAIEKIEILRTPSAKYDASGSGGIVNVVLKKGVKIGMTGSVNAGWQQGTYGNEFGGFNLNNNDGKKSSYINLNYSRRNSYERIRTDRLFSPDSMLSQDAFTKYPASVYFTSYGFAYALNKKWDLDFAGSVTLNDYDNRADNRNMIKKISTSQLLTNNLNNVSNNGSSFIFSNGLEAKLKIDSLGSEWDNDVYYTFSHNKSDQLFATSPATPSSGGDGKSDNKRGFLQQDPI